MRRWLKWLIAGAVLLRMFGPRIQPTFRPPQEHPLRLPGHTVFVGDDEYLVREMGPVEGDPVLLVHGLAGSSLTEWYQVAPKLAVDRRVIMIDHRGHGLSARADLRFDVADDADDLTGVLDALGVGQVDVVGYSMGGVIAQAMAQRNPGRVRKLVLIATFATHSMGAPRRGLHDERMGAHLRIRHTRDPQRLSDRTWGSPARACPMGLAGDTAT
jgi:pimeloyl-ACP methyl ester carboxylesterase